MMSVSVAGIHMWTAPSRKGVAAAMVLVGCGHMSGLCGAVG
jgi:hypothetical protein